MNRTRLTTLIAGLALALAPSLFAGEIGEDLSLKINSSRQDQKIRVWITLPRAESAAKFKATLLSQSDTRRGRHELALQQLKDENSHAQRGLINALEQLKSRGQASGIKSHWITNLVEAEVAAGQLRALAARGDVERVIIPPEIVLISPVEEKSAPGGALAPDSVTSNLKYIHAPEAWAAGWTGAGRVICSFDTGIQGTHPALYSSWKGLDGDSAAAWFDPIDHESFPHTIPDCGLRECNTEHGTHVMGILVGHTDTDTIGVAPGAKWISAAVIDISGASIIDGFEWAADPDGDPNTVSDVPDVINHSWGLSKSVAACENIFYDVIENVEALGIVNIFAAGNRYEPADTIVFNPANRATDSITSFAVGNLNTYSSPATLAASSSHGPSDCVGPSFKPNVVAPGTNIYSSWPGSTYHSYSGTSMAAPHVSGLVALLRQKNPNATVDQIKTAILNGTQENPAWGGLPNNHYGWGAIDCMGALDTLPTTASKSNIRIYAFDHAPIHPGDTVTGQVTLQNLGATAINIMGALADSDPSLSVLDGVATFGSLLRNTTVQAPENLRVVVSDTVSTGSLLGLDFVIFSGSTAIDTLHLGFQVVPPLVKTIASHVTSKLAFSVSNWGGLGLGPLSQFPAGGLGFDFNNGGNDLYEGGLMMGNSAFRVSSAVHSYFWDPDMDFNVAPGGNFVLQAPGPIAAQQTSSAFIDSHAADPFDILVKQNSYTYDPPDDDFVILQYVLKNTSDVTVTNFYFGIFLDWDIVSYNSDAGGYEPDDGIAWMAYNGAGPSDYRGMKMLEGPFYTAQTGRSDLIVYAKYLDPSANGYTTSEKYTSLSNGTSSADTYKTSKYDLFQVMAAGPMVLAPGAEQTVTFALLAGDTYADIANAAARATLAPTPVEEPPGGDVLPKTFALYQNYPNPFNPSTVISFDLPRASEYTLTIFNVLGQKVHEVTGRGRAGRVDVEWDASSFSSGVYFYRVATDKFSESKKMLLLK